MLDARTKKSVYPLVVLGDLNAAVGSSVTKQIGDCNSHTEDCNELEVRKLAGRFGLTIPATFFALALW